MKKLFGVGLKGRRFGRLTAIRLRVPKGNRSQVTWRCRCDCGNERMVVAHLLLSGRVKSCGCLFRPHGMFGTPEYGAWIEMRRRCNDPKRKDFVNYGKRGIRVCSEWNDPKTGFIAFFAAIGKRPSPQHTLGRKENDGDYTPENCEWQTVSEQNKNRRNSRVFAFSGQELSLMEWVKKVGISYETLASRIRRGWPVEAALTVPVGRSRRT